MLNFMHANARLFLTAPIFLTASMFLTLVPAQSQKPREVEDVDLRPGRFATLTLIGCNPGISQTALSRANGRDKSTLTPVLDDLVRRGLVHRVRTPADRRTYQLTLTLSGARMLQRLTDGARRHEDKLDRLLGAKDRQVFLEILRRIETEM